MTDGELMPALEKPLVDAQMGEAAMVAKNAICRQIVASAAIDIRGKKYVKVEGWRALAAAHGCTLSSRDVERVYDDNESLCGYRAIGEVRRASDGAVLAVAEGFVGDQEKMWAKRDVFARRAMAQTRAQSRAAKSCFDFVLVLMGSYQTTPAEEMQAADQPTARPDLTPAAAPAPAPPPPSLYDRAVKAIDNANSIAELNDVSTKIRNHHAANSLTDDEKDSLTSRAADKANMLTDL